MAIIKFVNEKKEIQVPEGSNLRKEAMAAGVGLYPGIHKVPELPRSGSVRQLPRADHQRDGKRQPGRFLGEDAAEILSFAIIGHEDTMRLSCQTKVYGDMEVVTKPPMNWFGDNFFS